MAKFSDIPQFLLNEYFSILDTLQTTPTTTDAHLRNDTIITKGGNLLELYVDEDGGYRRIFLNYSSLTSDVDNLYFLNKHDQLTFESTSTEYTEEGAYFKIYDASTLESVEVQNGQSVYFRKDSVFHDWLKDGADTVFQNRWYSDFLTKNFINTNEFYVYFGKIYINSGDIYTINYENLPEFTKRILPEHQRSTKIKEFLNLSFGNIFLEIYNKTKNLPTLIDAMTIDNDLLNYIVEFTNWSFTEKDEYTLAEREFVRDIVKLLKTKGTISSIYTLYNIFSDNSINKLNVYERWHDSTLSGQISAGQYYDYLYLHNYITSTDTEYLSGGAGTVYYQQFLPDFEWGGDSTYISVYSSSTWNVSHNLDTYNIIYQVYDNNFKKVSPASAHLSDSNTLVLTFDSSFNGYCFVKSSTYKKTIDSGYSSIFDSNDTPAITGSAIDHDFDLVEAMSMNYKNDYHIQPNIIKLRENHIETEITDGYIVIDRIDERQPSTTSNDVWTITHTLGMKGVLVDVYGTGDERIIPEDIQILDEDTVRLTFSESLSGYVLLSEIGKPPDSTAVTEFDDLILSPHYIVEIDLTTEPIDDTNILTESTSETLISYWEKIRPINNVSNYQLLLSPMTDMSGIYYNIYESVSAYVRSKMLIEASHFDTGDSSSYYVSHFTENNTTWVINHDLSSPNLLIQCYNSDSELIVPATITYSDDDTVIVEFNTIVNGTAVMATSSYTTTTSLSAITHSLNDDVINMTTDSLSGVYKPNNVTLTDDNTLTIEDILPDSNVYINSDTSTFNFTNSSVWTVEHWKGIKWFLSECYNSSDERIYPDKVTLIDEDSASVEFSTNVTGYIVLYSVPESITIYNKIVTGHYTGPYIAISDTQDDMATYDYRSIITDATQDDDYIYLTAEIPKDNKYTIREIGVIDVSDNVLFTTICSDIVKDNDVKMIIYYKISKGEL